MDPVVQIGKVLNLDVGMEKHDCPRAHFHFRGDTYKTSAGRGVRESAAFADEQY